MCWVNPSASSEQQNQCYDAWRGYTDIITDTYTQNWPRDVQTLVSQEARDWTNLSYDEFAAQWNSSRPPARVDYRDGTVTPPAVLPPMLDRCDVVMTLDNKAPDLVLNTPATNDCGVIKWTLTLNLEFNIVASQENSRLRSWGLQYTKGVLPAVHMLANGTSNNDLHGAPMMVGLSSTCAFAVKLWAYSHVRDGRNWVYYREKIAAIAIEKCS